MIVAETATVSRKSPDHAEPSSLETYVRLVWRYWWAFLIGLLLGAACGLILAFVQPKVYKAESTGFIITPSTDGVGSAMVGDSYAKSRAKSYADLGEKKVVAEDVIAQLGLDDSPEELVGRISITVPTDTVNIRVTASASTARGASDLANAWISAMATQVSDLETCGVSGCPEGAMEGEAAALLVPLESASIPTTPSSPNRRLYVAAGLVAGLAVALASAIVRNQYDKRIRSIGDLAMVTDVPIIGTLPLQPELEKDSARRASMLADSPHKGRLNHQWNEALRGLRTNIEFLDVDNPPTAIVITSALPGDGKSTVASNLAVILMHAGKRVVLIDGDLRKPVIAKTFGLLPEPGLTDLLAGRVDLSSVLQQPSWANDLYVLTSGSIPPNPSELLASDAFSELVAALVAEDILVVVDAPPLLPVTDASVLTARTDGALVVVSAGRTRTDSLASALQNIERVRGRALGIVLNRQPTKGVDKYAYGYYDDRYYSRDSSVEQGSLKRAS